MIAIEAAAGPSFRVGILFTLWLLAAAVSAAPPPVQTDWKAIDGCAREISIIEFDRPLVIGCAGTGQQAGERGYEIYRRNSGQWVRQPGAGYRILDLGPRLTFWKIDLKGVVWRSGTRQSDPTECIAEITASDRPDIWMVTCPDRNGNTRVLRASNILPAATGISGDMDVRSWQRMASAYRARKIAVGDEIWMMSREGALYTFDPAINNWKERPGCATDIAANGAHVWVIGCEAGAGLGNQIFRWENQQWVLKRGAGIRIAVDRLGNPWVVDSRGGIWNWTFRRPGG